MTDTKIEYAFGIPYNDLPHYKVKPSVGNVPVSIPQEINYELLDEILAFVKAHPQTWRQESWYKYVDSKDGTPKYFVTEEEVTETNSCGAAFCFAGHVAIREGFPAPPKDSDTWWSRKVYDETHDQTYSEEASDFARKILGLRSDQADVLFAPNNTIEDLEDIIEIFKTDPSVEGYEIEDGFIEENSDRSVDGLSRLTVEEFLANLQAA